MLNGARVCVWGGGGLWFCEADLGFRTSSLSWNPSRLLTDAALTLPPPTTASRHLPTPQVFTSIGQLELFYDQAPDVMRSCSMALQLLSVAIGSYLSGARACTGVWVYECMNGVSFEGKGGG